MTDSDPLPELTTSQNGGQSPVASLDAITTLVHSFAMMIQSMKADILREMEKNAEVGRERWVTWDQQQRERWEHWERETQRYRTANDERLGKIEDKVDTHLKEEEREDIIAAARIAPVRTTFELIVHNWKMILIIIFAVIGALGIGVDLWKDISRIVVP